MSVLQELRWRGLVYDASEGLENHLTSRSVTVYIGFDPTAASLHVGNLLQILGLARMQRHGHRPIALVGGGTGLIGDPSGKSKERQLLTAEKVAENAASIRAQLEPLLEFDCAGNAALMIDNAEWLTTVPLIDFLRDVGKHFSVGSMLAKESVKKRLEGEGISFTEFSYQLLQSWDFVELNRRYDCTLQMGGSDQWGNITAGIDLVRRMAGARVHGLVQPLVTTAAGTKFGKTEAGTVWLDPALTSPYRFYQFWYNTSDQDAATYLRYFTHLDQPAIAELEQAMASAPQERAAQQRLAQEVTTMVHGADACARAMRSSRVLFGGEIADLSAADVLEIFDDVPSSRLEATSFGNEQPLVELLATSGLVPSKGAARRLIHSGGAYVNNRRVSDPRATVRREDFLDGRVLVLRKGPKTYHLLTLED
ncbi:MAG: tyrosine--tRNA ligase [Acidobacteria bacterium]|nr:MAG: tyrosine--tRNA ligase [Acidobacteriota bacterium]